MKRKVLSMLLAVALTLGLAGCQSTEQTLGTQGTEVEGGTSTEKVEQTDNTAYGLMKAVNTAKDQHIQDKYMNVYEICPYSFCDSNGDGVGDLQGLISKLDYLNDNDDTTDTDLGIDAIWMTPICDAQSYHKYDVNDYCSIDPEFGTMDDFDALVKACEEREIKIIFDLVVNHTSSAHPWFAEACKYLYSLEEGKEPSVEECPYLEYYNFTKEAKSGFHKVPATEDWYYEGQFYSGMPDLNLDSQAVLDEISKITQFWIDHGVYGFRLDAVTSYYTGDDAKNVKFMTWLNDNVKKQKKDAYIVGEAWTFLAKYGTYYQSGVDSFFDFDFASNKGKIATALRSGSALDFGKAIVEAQQTILKNSPSAVDAAFTSNHDMGRNAGVYAGATGQSMIKMSQAMAMMMGGSYYLYYGDELGMKGSGEDPNYRAPMQWSADESAEGMCKTVATKEIKMTNGSYEEQSQDGNSIYQFIKQGLAIRNAYPEIARGINEVIEELSNENVLVLKKIYQDEETLVVFNLSEEKQTVDLSSLGKEYKEAAMLITGEEAVQVEGNVLTMPALSIEIVK